MQLQFAKRKEIEQNWTRPENFGCLVWPNLNTISAANSFLEEELVLGCVPAVTQLTKFFLY